MPNQKMRTIKMPASALEDADVQYISLVSRPANRIPFRITKAEDIPESTEEETENLMFHLNTFLKRKTDTDPASTGPSVAAVVIRKEDTDSLLPQLSEAGLVTDNQQEQDDVVILKQSDYDEGAVAAVKINDDILLLVTDLQDVQKAFEPYGEASGDFDENVKVAGFMPGLHMATEALFDTYRNILMESATKEEAATAMKSAIESYSGYVSSLADNLPEMAFKLEAMKAEAPESVEKDGHTGDKKCPAGQEYRDGKCVAKDGEEVSKDDGEEATAAAEEVSAETTEKSEEVTKTEDIKEAVAGDHEEGLGEETTAKSEDEGAGEGSESAVKEDTEEKGEATDFATALAAIKSEIMEGISGVQNELTAVKETADSLKDRLDAVEEVAKSADEAVRGTVQSGSDDIRNEGFGTRERTNKSDKDDEVWDGLLDNVIGQ